MPDVDQVNGLFLLVSDLVTDLVADGRMPEAEAAMWERHAAAIAMCDPERVVRGM